MFEKLKQKLLEYKKDILSWLKRNPTALLLSILMLWFIDFDKDVLRLTATAIFYISLAVPVSGYVRWGLTKLELTTRDVATIYLAVSIIFAFVIYMK